MREAMFYKKLDKGIVRCYLCAHSCLIPLNRRGICQVYQNQKGSLYSLAYGKIVVNNCDPIEKKPLFHFLPGTCSYSIATVSCNFQCGFCQNFDISQSLRERRKFLNSRLEYIYVTPEKVVDQALAFSCASISYTYTEPTIYFEYAYDCMKLAVNEGLKNIFISNGYESPDCLAACQGFLHAANIDLKSFRNNFYLSECKAKLQPVLDTLKRLYTMGVWLEVTTLLIPSKNDDPQELKELTSFIAHELSCNVPWHVSAYMPCYKYKNVVPNSTSLSSLEKALAIGRESGLVYVYAGNVFGHLSENTFCAFCNKCLIIRRGFAVTKINIENGKCFFCGHVIPGIW